MLESLLSVLRLSWQTRSYPIMTPLVTSRIDTQTSYNLTVQGENKPRLLASVATHLECPEQTHMRRCISISDSNSFLDVRCLYSTRRIPPCGRGNPGTAPQKAHIACPGLLLKQKLSCSDHAAQKKTSNSLEAFVV